MNNHLLTVYSEQPLTNWFFYIYCIDRIAHPCIPEQSWALSFFAISQKYFRDSSKMSLQASSRAYISTITRLSHTPKRLYHQIPQINRLQASSSITNHATSRIQCHTRTPQTQTSIQLQRHTFSSSASLSKKKDKNKRTDDAVESSSSKKNDSGNDATAPDPFDFSQLHTGISDATARLKEDLQKLRSGGRFNPEVIEQLRVNLVKGSNETVRLGEVAQVVPKGGRSVVIIVGEEDASLFPFYILGK
jgi:ribosome recycling factor